MKYILYEDKMYDNCNKAAVFSEDVPVDEVLAAIASKKSAPGIQLMTKAEFILKYSGRVIS